MNGAIPSLGDFLFTYNGRELAIGWSTVDFSAAISIKENGSWTWLDVVPGDNFDTMTRAQIVAWVKTFFQRITAKLKMFFGDTGEPDPDPEIPNVQGEQFLIWLMQNRIRRNGLDITLDDSGI